jgi:hypothetical protein
LQGKIKKHQAFEAEIFANQQAINTLTSSGQALIAQHHYASEAIQKRIESLQAQWKHLELKSGEKTQRLREMQLLVVFKLEAGEVESWIKDKTPIASMDDTGNDLEHVDVLEKKFDDFSNDIVANETRLESLNANGLNLISEGHPDVQAIKDRLQV